MSKSVGAGVLSNDSQAQGDPLTAVLVTGPSHGSLTLNANGSFTYTPNNGYTGGDSFTYKVNDGYQDGNSATVNLTLDHPPVAVDDSFNVAQDVAFSTSTTNLLTNDTDADSDSLTTSRVGQPSHGTVTVGESGTFTYTPTAGYYGTDTFTYKVNDGWFDGNTATVTLTIRSTPTVVNKSFTDVKNTSLNVLANQGLLVGATNADTFAISAANVTQPSHGTVTINANGSFSYIPTNGYYGPDSFTYRATNGPALSSPATVSIYVDQPPVGVADHYNVVENTGLSRNAANGVLANDTNTNTFTSPVALTASLVSTTSHGNLNLFTDGSFQYVPTTGYYGTDTFTYQANDGITDSPVTTVTITVDAPPVGVSDSYVAIRNQSLSVNASNGVLTNDTDIDTAHGGISASLISNAGHGTVTLYNDGSFVYAPADGYYGTDGFTYKPYDGITNGNLTTVNILIDRPALVVDENVAVAQDHVLSSTSGQNVLSGATNYSANSLTAVLVSGPEHGSLTLNSDGSFDYTPDSSYFGNDSFTFVANDGYADSVTPATVSIVVVATPVANDDYYTMLQDQSLSVFSEGSLLFNDTQAQSRQLYSSVVTGPSHGTLSLNTDGSFDYTPDPGYYGTDTYTYQDTDGVATSNVATVSILVDAPVVGVTDDYHAIRNTALTVNGARGVLANDTQAQGHILSIYAFYNFPTHGTLATGGDGSFTYTPDAGYTGPDSFTYISTDGIAYSDLTTANLTVVAPPTVSLNVGFGAREGRPLDASVDDGLQNFSHDPQGLPLTASVVSEPSHGTFTFHADGSFLYVPDPYFVGTDTFTFKVNNGYADSNIGTFFINVAQDYDPVAVDDAATVARGGVLTIAAPGILGNDTDLDDDPLTAVLASTPAHGRLSFNGDGSFVYTPDANFVGVDSFTYRAYDGVLAGNLATVTLTVTGGNHAPVALNDSFITNQETALTTIDVNGVLANDTDSDGNTLTAILVAGPAHGSLTLNADGSFTYTPAANFSGTDSFTYRVNDGQAVGNTATATITVNHVNHSPIALDDEYATSRDTPLVRSVLTGILANDTDSDSDPLTAILLTNPTHGTLALNGDGSFVYTPDANFSGLDSFTYKVNDGLANSNVATVSVFVSGGNRLPVAVNDSYTTNEGVALVRTDLNGVIANDTDLDGNTLESELATGPAHGTLVLRSFGSFTYTPDAGFFGTDSFTYSDYDGHGNGNTATVTITVNHVNQAPVAADDTFYSTLGQSPLITNALSGVLVNDTDANDDPLTAILVTNPAHGTLIFNGDGSYTYTPAHGFLGLDSFTYKVNDGQANSNIATVSIFMHPPIDNNDFYSTNEGTTLTTTAIDGVLANDIDVNGIEAFFVGGPAHGSLALNSDGSFTYTPDAGFLGIDTFAYFARDAEAIGSVATVTINVTSANPLAPLAVNDSETVAEAGLSVGAPGILANDINRGVTPLTTLLVTGPAHGTLTFHSDGSYTYLPNSSFGAAGSDSFTYRVTDGSLASNLATVVLTFDGNYYTPTAHARDFAVAEGGTLSVNWIDGLLLASYDFWSLPLTVIVTGQPGHGTLDAHADGTFTYVPAAGFSGTDSFTYEVNNGHTSSIAQTVTLTVNRVNRPPVGVDDSYSTIAGTPLTINALHGVLANDTDSHADPLTAILVNNPSHGSVALNGDGSFTYTPAAGFTGSDSFTYKDNDGRANGNTSTVHVTVTPVVHSPTAADDHYSTTAGGPALSVPALNGVLANDTDPDGHPLTAVLLAGPSHGTLSINANGSFSYSPNDGFTGLDTFTYRATDGDLAGNVATVSLTVNPAVEHPRHVNGDYNKDGKADIVIYLPSIGAFAFRSSDGAPDRIIPFGLGGPGQTIPAPGDYFGTGQTHIAAYLPSRGEFALRNPDGSPDVFIPFGRAGLGQSIPAPGDYFGTGLTNLAVYLPSEGAFAIRNPAGGPDLIIPFGIAGAGQSIPVPGDYDGSGKTELAVYLPSMGALAYRPANGGPDRIIPFGIAGTGQSIPMPGDYDGSGRTEPAVYLPSNGTFVYRPAGGGADVTQHFGLAGVGMTLPAVGDYTGSGHDELAAFLPNIGVYAYRPADGRPDVLQTFGMAGAGLTIPVTVVDQALAEMPTTGNVSARSIVIPDSIAHPGLVTKTLKAAKRPKGR